MKPSLKTCTIFFIKPLSLFSNFHKISTIDQNAIETQIHSVLFHNNTANINMAPTYSFQETPHRTTRGGQAVQVQKEYQIFRSVVMVQICQFLTLGVKLPAFNSWCQIVQSQIVQSQIVQY